MATATQKRKTTPAGISIAPDTLRKALATVRAAVGGMARPVLQNVYIGGGVVEATDLEMRISCEIDYQGPEILLPYARLSAILGAASSQEVLIGVGESSCTISIGSSKWTLPTEPATEFPAWSVADAARKPVARIPADQFARAVRSVSYAADNESSRYALGGVMVEVQDGSATFVATDGRRLSRYDVEIDQAVDPSATLWPSRAINTIAALASHSEGAVQLESAGSELIATIEGIVVASRVVEGRYPRWRDVFPEREASATVADRQEMLAATRQAAIVTSEQSKGVTYSITSEGISLAAKSSEAGESSVTCPILDFGQAATVKLDPVFVCDFLKACDDGEPVEIEAVDSSSAVVLRSGDCRGVIMPLCEE